MDEVSTSDLLALGTSTGSLMVYSVKQGDVVTTFDVSNHKARVHIRLDIELKYLCCILVNFLN